MVRRKNKTSSEIHELNFEEVVLDDWASDFDVLEFPLPQAVFYFTALALLLIGAVVLLRVGELAILDGKFYSTRALLNANKVIIHPAPRGIIFDRYGKPLVENVPSFSVALKVSEFLRLPSQERNRLISELGSKLNISEDNIRARIEAADIEELDRIVLSANIGIDTALSLKKRNIPAVLIEDSLRRHYFGGGIFSHIVGYTGLASAEDIKRDPSLRPNHIVGKTGIEAIYDSLLRGTDGTTIKIFNAKGELLEERQTNISRAGEPLHLTLDAEFQAYFARRLAQGLTALGRTSGAGLAIDPQNGEVLALVSLPTFDANVFVDSDKIKERAALLSLSTKPLFNRVVSGLYNPASTIKPLHAVAALAEKVVTPETNIFSAGYIEIPNPYDPSRSTLFLDWKPHGWVDVHSALARSSNIYFYEVGGGYGDMVGLGIERLRLWWQKFLLGKPTGIDLPGEAGGFLPSPQEKEKRTGQIWRIGDTYNVSIGQGDILVTPLQLLNYIAAIANGGVFYRPHLLLDAPKEILADLSAYRIEIEEVQKGMRDAVREPYGTAYLLHDLPFEVAAKTGSAQVEGNKKTNALFVGYAPASSPKIAILVLIEDAREGSLNAVPIARDLFAWYYENRIKKAQ